MSPPPSEPANPDEIPGITLARELGHGGFGTVYLGRDTVVGRDVAVKIDRRTLASDSDRRRFAREVTAAGQVSAHPNIVTLLSGGVTRAGRPYLVMELCPGGSLDTRLRESGPLPAADVVRIGIAIADALAAAHAVGILHRDVKPANILTTVYGAPALTDFGLASLPAQWDIATMSQFALTPSFAAPESFEHKADNPQADVYSLGATLYSLIAGRPPRWTDSGPPSLAEMVELSREPLPRLDVPGFPGLVDAIAHATAPDLAQRTPNAAVLRDELLAVAASTLPGDDLRRYAPAVGLGTVPASAPSAGPTQAMPLPPGPSAADGSPARNPGGDGPSGTVLLPAPRPEGAGPSGPDSSATPTERLTDPSPKRSLKGRTALIAACAALLLAGGAWGAMALQNRDDGADRASRDAATGTTRAGADSASAIDPADLPQVGSCWGGLVYSGSQAPTAKELPCGEEHRWVAFAVGTLDPDTDYTVADDIEADRVAVRTCTIERLAEYLDEDAPPTAEIAVLGPRQALADKGDRTFVCLWTAS